ncbi:hypothetical protein RJ641_002218, partial [Dillenia turbinata]
MPAQKRTHNRLEEEEDEDDLYQTNNNHNDDDHNNNAEDQDPDDSDRSPSSDIANKDEYIVVNLADIRKDVQCPICLGIIRKTRTVMECLHRFCRECIDKSMRLGNNECPACRTHCASRRSLRDDPNYDAMIAALYPDIEKYEEEELAFHEEDKTRNKQIQDFIAQTCQRQSEAHGRKRGTDRASGTPYTRRRRRYQRSAHLRGRRNYRDAELQGSDDEEVANGNDRGGESSSADEHSVEPKPKRSRKSGARLSLPSAVLASVDGGYDENDSEMRRESVGASAYRLGGSEMLAWGKAGIRSHTRYGGNGKNGRNSRLSKLLDYVRNLEEDKNELDIHLMLISFDEQMVPSLQQPYLCCKPTISVQHLCQYVALQTSLPAENIEILMVKELHSKLTISEQSPSISGSRTVDPFKDVLQLLGAEETLAGIQALCSSSAASDLQAKVIRVGELVINYQRHNSQETWKMQEGTSAQNIETSQDWQFTSRKKVVVHFTLLFQYLQIAFSICSASVQVGLPAAVDLAPSPGGKVRQWLSPSRRQRSQWKSQRPPQGK